MLRTTMYRFTAIFQAPSAGAIWVMGAWCPKLVIRDAGWSSSVARWAHNPEVTGSNPVPATKIVAPD